MGMKAKLVPVTMAVVERLRAPATIGPDPFISDRVVKIDKTWAVLHFLFTGTPFEVSADPLSLAILGGARVGRDRGFGPARALTPEEVAEVAHALATTNFDHVWKRFDRGRIKTLQIYPCPGPWDESEAHLREWLEPEYDALAECYTHAAQAGEAMLIVIE